MYILIPLMHWISLILGHEIFFDSDVANDIAWSVPTLSQHSVENQVLGRNIPVASHSLQEA
jgi:hypothetical protein